MVKDFDERVTGVHLFDVSVYVARLVPLAAEITLGALRDDRYHEKARREHGERDKS